jgi:hypothetical protein
VFLHSILPRVAARPHARAAVILLTARLLVPVDGVAQTLPPFPEPRIEVTVDAGVVASTRWFRDEAGNGTPSAGPTFGAGIELPVTPDAALRLRASYAAQRLEYPVVPGPSTGSNTVLHTVRVRGLAYELSLVARPFGAMAPDALRHLWLSAGAGAATTWFGSDLPLPPPTDTTLWGCLTEFSTSGVCIPRHAATRAQATAGIGVDLVPLGRGASLFASFDVHVQRPPVRRVAPVAAMPDDDSGNRIPPVRFGASPAPVGAAPGTAQAVAHISRASATGRATAGVRIALHRAAPPVTLPPAPPAVLPPAPRPASDSAAFARPAPTTGGYVEVRTAAPGAAVYLVPFSRWRRATMLCQLRPVHGTRSYYQGTTASSVAVNALIRRPVTHFLVVVQGGRYYEERIQVVNNGVERRALNMAVDGVPTGCR